MDHFSPVAVKSYFEKFDKGFQDKQGQLSPAFFNDSYEVYGADWTPAFLKKNLPHVVVIGWKSFSGLSHRNELNWHVVWCLIIETLGELLVENFTTAWTKWAHGHGSTTRNQAHGSPANLIDTYASVDIPECEGFGLTDFHIRGWTRDSITRPNFRYFHAEICFFGCTYCGKPYTFFWNIYLVDGAFSYFPLTV